VSAGVVFAFWLWLASLLALVSLDWERFFPAYARRLRIRKALRIAMASR